MLSIILFPVLCTYTGCLALKMPFVLCRMVVILDMLVPQLQPWWAKLTAVDTRVLWTSATSVAGEHPSLPTPTAAATMMTSEWFVWMVSITQFMGSQSLQTTQCLVYHFYFAEITTEEIGTPTDIRLIESSTTTLTIGWVVSGISFLYWY